MAKCHDCPIPGTCIAERTGHLAFCAWAHSGRPDRLARIAELSAGLVAPAEYPPLYRQAANLAGAIGRVVVAAAKGEPIRVPPATYHARLAICRACPFNGERPAGVRCMKCGCGGLKLELATEQCRDDPPRWGRWEDSA